jgi:hypothetical protein
MSGLNKTINLKIKKGVNTIIRKIKGKWKNLKEDYKSKPLFYKNKNQPLKMVYNAQEVNVLYGGDFSKKFKKLVRKAVREGKRFSLPRIRTFKDLAINRSGNIVNKNKAIVEYQHNFTVKIKIVINNDGKTFVKEYPLSYRSKTRRRNLQKQRQLINDLLAQLSDDYADVYVEENDAKKLTRTLFNENVNSLFDPPAPSLIRGGFIPDNKYIDNKQVWDTKEGSCFYDYLKYLYSTPMKNGKYNCKVPKRLRVTCMHKKRVWEELNCMYGCFDEEHMDWAVSCDMIERFCKRFKINCYLINQDDQFIFHYNKGNKYTPSIFCKIIDGHLNPIVDAWKRKSLTKKAQASKKAKKKKKEEEEKEPTELEVKYIPVPSDNEKKNMIDLMIEKMCETNMMPKPFTLGFDKMSIHTFELDGIKYVYETEEMKLAETFYKNIGDKAWNGRGLKSYGIKMFNASKELFHAKSRMSPDVYDLFTNKQVKDRSQRGWLCKNRAMGELQEVNKWTMGFDINKAYTDCVLNPVDSWYVVGFNSVWKKYNQKVKLNDGFYYVETDDITLFHKTNIYSKAIVEYGLKKGIILKSNIKYYLNVVATKKKTLFHKLFYNDYMECGSKKVGKFLCNLTTGLCGKSTKKKICPKISTQFEDVNCYLDKNKDVFIQSYPIKMDKEGPKHLYIYGQEHSAPLIDNHIPLYVQILDNMNIKQYEMMKKFLKKDIFENITKYPIYRKVDMFACDKKYLRKNWENKLSNEIGGYKMEIPKKFYQSSYDFRGLNSINAYDGEVYNNVDKLINISLSPEKERIIDITDSNEWEKVEKALFGDFQYNGDANSTFYYKPPKKACVCITGDGGTGKSHIIKKISENHSALKMTFTNKAAMNIDGKTFHRGFGLNKRMELPIQKMDSIARKYDCIIIDEISMNASWAWNYIIWCQHLTRLPLLLCGDWGQVEPVEMINNLYGTYEKHPRIKHLIKSCAELKVNHRVGKGQEDFAKLLHDNKHNMNMIDISDFTPMDDEDELITKHICYLNKTRKLVNLIVSEEVIEERNIKDLYDIIPAGKVEQDEFFAEPYMEGKEEKYTNPTQKIKVFVGTPMTARLSESNDEGKTHQLINNEEWVITEINDEDVILKSLDRKELYYKIKLKKLQNKFLVAWAITTHKAQGQTIKQKIKIWDWGKMDTKLRYTAMSRVTKREHCCIQPTYY